MRYTITLLLLLLVPGIMEAHHDVDTTVSIDRANLNPGHRIDFIENKGQWNERVLYRAETQKAVTFVESNCFTIVLRAPVSPPRDHNFHHQRLFKYHAYRVNFNNCQDAIVSGLGKSETYSNYYIGNDPEKWASHVAHYGSIEYKEIYKSIDLRVYGAENALKYEFIIHPGGSPDDISISYDGVRNVRCRNNNIVMESSIGKIIESEPYVYQEVGDDTVVIPAQYVVEKNNIKFQLGQYDTTQPLIIDPYLYFSTYSGSTADNWGTTAAYDSQKNTFTAGIVFGTGYPTSLGAYDSTFHGNADVGIFKFDTSGSQRIYATYLGGTHADMPHSMYVNAFDELIIFGTTGSIDFPTSANAYSRTFQGGTTVSYLDYSNSYTVDYYKNIYYPNGSDIFISRFSSDGTQLQASTYIGGNGNDGLNYKEHFNANQWITVMDGNDSLYYNYGDGARGEIITDDLNNIYLGSTTMSHDFPTTPNCIQSNFGGGDQDGIVLKIDYNLSNLLWSTYLGGAGDDAVYSIDVDQEYNLLVCGGTNSTNFPTTSNSYHPAMYGGSADGFVAKIAYNGSSLMSSTYYGSLEYDQCYFVRCGGSNDVFIFGQTKALGSTLIYNANYNTPNSGQFLARLAPNLDTLRWSTVFGTGSGSPNISPTAFGADICDRVYAVGWGRDFVGYNNVQWQTAGTYGMEITNDAFQTTTDGQDFYIIAISADASTLDYATFFGEFHTNASGSGGGDHVDGGTSRFDKLATLYQSVCGGCGGSDLFPTTTWAWSQSNNSTNCNNALFRFNIHNDFPVAEFASVPVGCVPYTINFNNTGRGDNYYWDFGDGTTSTQRAPSHTYDSAGLYTVQLIATKANGCKTADTMTREILVIGGNHARLQNNMSCSGEPMQIGPQPMTGCQYLWISGSVSDSTIANPWITTSGDYVLQTTADAGCIQIDTFRIDFIELIDSIVITHPRCPGDSNGQIEIIANSTSPNQIEYTINGIPTEDSIISGLPGGIYIIELTDGFCESSQEVRLRAPQSPPLNKEMQQWLCNDSCEAWIHLRWGTVDTLLQNLCEGVYITTLTDSIGCTITDTSAIVVQHSLDNITAWADDTNLFLTQSTMLHTTQCNGCTYSWTPAETLNNPTSPTPTATPIDTTTYIVVVTDSTGCTKTDSVKINCTELLCGPESIFIPNAFTPNSDGINDYLEFKGKYIIDFHFALFTRWGELVWESRNINDTWDGKYRDNWCMPGVYMYTCKITCETGEETLLKGDITIIR